MGGKARRAEVGKKQHTDVADEASGTMYRGEEGERERGRERETRVLDDLVLVLRAPAKTKTVSTIGMMWGGMRDEVAGSQDTG